jgi:hypothetical protein
MQTNISGRLLPTLGVSLICGVKLSDIKQMPQMNIFLHLESMNCLENICVLYLLILILTEFSNGQKMKHQNLSSNLAINKYGLKVHCLKFK